MERQHPYPPRAQRESSSCPHVPCERSTHPQSAQQPAHRASPTAHQLPQNLFRTSLSQNQHPFLNLHRGRTAQGQALKDRTGTGSKEALKRPHKGQATKRPSGSGSGRSEHWNVNTLTPLAHSAKASPPQSLLSERRPDTADNVAERCQAVASLGGEHPTPSRKARKHILLRAYSASGGLIPRSPAHQKPERSGVGP